MAGRRAQAYIPPARFGSYEVHELLGKGGMATVFRGEHTLLQRPVAIKFLHHNIAQRPSGRERFLREARLVAKLAHPNIVTVFDFGKLEDGTYYQASELVAGRTLRRYLKASGPLPAAMALQFARQLADGLRSAHDIGVIHRDLKPSNVMVVDDAELDGYRLKILDFGLAKSLEPANEASAGDLTKAGTALGTPGFMAPEQYFAGPDIGPASDIYSLGVVLFVMLCGHAPFVASDTEHLIGMHIADHPPRPSGTVLAVPAEVDDLIVRCLAKRPEDRPQTMRDVIEQIDKALVALERPAVLPDVAEVLPVQLGEPTQQVDRFAVANTPRDTEPDTLPQAAPTPTPAPMARRRSRRAWAVVGAAFAIAGAAIIVAGMAPSDRSRTSDDSALFATPIEPPAASSAVNAPIAERPVVDAGVAFTVPDARTAPVQKAVSPPLKGKPATTRKSKPVPKPKPYEEVVY